MASLFERTRQVCWGDYIQCEYCFGTGVKGGYDQRKWRIRSCRSCGGAGSFTVADPSMDGEVWREDVESPRYRISNFGRMFRLPLGVGHRGARILACSLSHKGRPVVNIGGIKEVHTLVALAFLGPRPLDYDINHKDGNKANNRVDNLEYVTHTENMQHARDTGLMRPVSGERANAAKLTDDDTRNVLAGLAAGRNHKEMAAAYNVSIHTISRISRKAGRYAKPF